ncbi:MAG TPA: efflux RND transporter periplasmic adaptor subunit [bacterium]|nr:efflux RND transporter periplasmic adaptor subunit [Candidatus Omnitrophota bacterium]HOJ61500.1 efflux RND transporter periplasmic adaptor subunit [bacterium]HOL94614.1 efflux RND transporter periplasmic adaptor subunit [bacterium]HPP02833.1 efflux RND transporter periplasmic adaptor subunit [bacterium]
MKALRMVIITSGVFGLVLVVGISVNALVNAKKQQLSQAPKYGESPVPVHVVAATAGEYVQGRDYLAVVEPVQKAEINARVQSTVERIVVDEGSRVKSGDLLLQLDDREIKANIESMTAQIAQVQAEWSSNTSLIQSLQESAAYWKKETDRDQSLAHNGAIPVSQAEKTRDQYVLTRGKLESAQEQSRALTHQIESLTQKKRELEITLGYYSIVSPFSGVVTQRFVDPGDIAMPGKPLLLIEDHSSLKLSFLIPQEDLPEVQEGAEVHFRIQGGLEKATLSHLFPALNESRMLRAEISLPAALHPIVKSGQAIPITVTLKRWPDATRLPVSAILQQGEQNYVYVVHNDRLEKTTVEILGNNGDEVAVLGIAPDSQVVEHAFLGWAKLAAGLEVEVYP